MATSAQPSATFKGLGFADANKTWESKLSADEADPYQNEWNDLVDAMRKDKPYNEVHRGVQASPGDVDGSHGRPHRPDRHL